MSSITHDVCQSVIRQIKLQTVLSLLLLNQTWTRTSSTVTEQQFCCGVYFFFSEPSWLHVGVEWDDVAHWNLTMNKLYRRWWRHATEARNLCMFLIVQIQPTKFTSLNSDCLVHTCWLLVWRIITLGLTSGFVGSITTRIKFLNDNISSF